MYKTFSPLSVTPTGWLRRQLEIQAAGLSGNLDKIWPDVRDSAWIGGSCEGWERVPYWLDGFIPLAYYLKDQDMIARAEHYIHSIIDRQQDDGWICPCSEEERPGYDSWACQLIGKVLAVYCEFSGDKLAEEALYRAMKCYYKLMAEGTISLFDWGKFRWYEGFIPLIYLYDRRPEDWMLELARLLKEQGANYPDFIETWKRPMNQWTFHTHIVNLMMMFKYEAVTSRLLGEKYTGKADELWNILYKYNGTAAGIITGDECLGGTDNNRGTELCAVVELMYSCGVIYGQTGDGKWADRLEKAAFNALPATNSEDMWTHQYDQQANQIACKTFPGKSFFGTNGSESHLFGLEPNYGCCTANFNQGWPKLVNHIFYQSKKGIVSAMMLPARLDTVIKDTPVSVEQISTYPFHLGCTYRIITDKPVSFELKIRIPGWAESVKVNGETVSCRGMYTVSHTWEGETEITLELAAAPRLNHRPHNLKALSYGPLMFSLPIKAKWVMKEYEKNGVERKFPYCDYELLPESPWNYGFAGDSFAVRENEVTDIPFSFDHPPVTISAKMAPVQWDYADGYDSVANVTPVSSRAIGEAETVELIPYGCAKLRMTEMPKIK